ncbi:toll/interleukin-1 receptor domain-containing protein [Ornithinimicrobium flavum]|uniref:toll/interleukin-1 receptor domain-containing protein n=1 Tax=Ornithinimicrobium flavum TaxID=1288636 RepID=UPI00106F93B2|nr:toll/interleukin-1 receptor domain-containing protein [Ornithinimicrobium flavum]
MSMLEQHQKQLVREREKRIRLIKDAQSIARRLSEQRPRVSRASSEAARRTQELQVARLEKDLVRAQGKVAEQDRVVANLQKKVDREEASAVQARRRAELRAAQERTRQDRRVTRELEALSESTDNLVSRVSDLESVALRSLATAVATDPVPRDVDVFLSYASPDKAVASRLRDELKARGLDVWMADEKITLGSSQTIAIDEGIGRARVGLCFVTPAYIEPNRFWTKHELAALINGRKRVIPVLAGLSFSEMQDFSALLGDRSGLSTADHGLDEIADLLARSMRGDDQDD